jgi:hypothetical protein
VLPSDSLILVAAGRSCRCGAGWAGWRVKSRVVRSGAQSTSRAATIWHPGDRVRLQEPPSRGYSAPKRAMEPGGPLGGGPRSRWPPI